MDERVRNIAIIAAAVVVVIGLVYFLASRTGPPEPTVPPGQDLRHPLGTAQAGGPGGPAGGPAAANPQAGRPRVPAAGTVDPRVGFGPSAGGPFRKH